jgi:hypothetical protein
MRSLSAVTEFTEQQAADSLGISLDELHRLLDEHIFNNGTTRPIGLSFTQSDLLLLSYWCGNKSPATVLQMPRKR